MKIIDDFFINMKLKKMDFLKKSFNPSVEMKNPKEIMIVWNEKLENSRYFPSALMAIKKKYDNARIIVLCYRYREFFSDLADNKIYGVSIPKPLKMKEIADAEKLLKGIKTDICFDFSTIDYRFKIMLQKIIKPRISITDYNEHFKDIYAILLKSDDNPLNMLRMLGYEIVENDIQALIYDKMFLLKTLETEKVFIGKSRGIMKSINNCIKEGVNYFHIEKSGRMNLKLLNTVFSSKQVIYDEKSKSDMLYFLSLKKKDA